MSVQAAAAVLTAGQESPELVPALMRLLQNPQESTKVRCLAIQTLGRGGQGTPDLIRALIAAVPEDGLIDDLNRCYWIFEDLVLEKEG